MKSRFIYLVLSIFILTSFCTEKEVYIIQNGSIYFKSYAPLEIIEATSQKLKGVIDPAQRTFVFTIEIKTFEGFNNPLQKEHFNENYLESHRYKTASFSGKIIEKTDLTKPGEYTLRAKGNLEIHGVKQERIIKSKATVKDEKLYIQSKFSVLLAEHDIAIPKIVYQKIAEEIEVTVKAEFLLTDIGY